MKHLILILQAVVILSISACTVDRDPLPSWQEGKVKENILQFVRTVTDAGNSDYIRPEDRIAVFDNDGTLWSERPVYFQLYFAMDRIRAMADDHPEWQDTQPYKAVLENDMNTLIASGEHGLIEIVMASHAGMSTEEFEKIVTEWIQSARHPETGRPYTEMVFQPMLELLNYLKQNGFTNYIVSGGGIEFMRPWTEAVYGIPAQQVIGSSIAVKFEMTENGPVLMRLPKLDFIDDKAGKPVGIHKFIGKRPVAAFGNSDGDLQMLQWTAAGSGKRLILIVHHTDDEREWAYDRDSHIGRLDKALDLAGKNGWLIADMKNDWIRIYPWSE